MTRIEILKHNEIEMIISKVSKKRMLIRRGDDPVSKEFKLSDNVSAKKLEEIFGEIEFIEKW